MGEQYKISKYASSVSVPKDAFTETEYQRILKIMAEEMRQAEERALGFGVQQSTDRARKEIGDAQEIAWLMREAKGQRKQVEAERFEDACKELALRHGFDLDKGDVLVLPQDEFNGVLNPFQGQIDPWPKNVQLWPFIDQAYLVQGPRWPEALHALYLEHKG